jgi:hypothetical protein
MNTESLIITVKSADLSKTELKAKTLLYFHICKAMTGALASNSNFMFFT